MKKLRFFARGTAAIGVKGSLRVMDNKKQPTVELIFTGHALHHATKALRSNPTDEQMVLVDGIERYFWVELAGRLSPLHGLRSVRGYDLRQRTIRVITTDDTRRYVFIVEPDLPRYVTDAIQPGPYCLAGRLGPLVSIPTAAVPGRNPVALGMSN